MASCSLELTPVVAAVRLEERRLARQGQDAAQLGVAVGLDSAEILPIRRLLDEVQRAEPVRQTTIGCYVDCACRRDVRKLVTIRPNSPGCVRVTKWSALGMTANRALGSRR